MQAIAPLLALKVPAGLPDRQGLRSTDLAEILYTSGTTGEPKAVMLSHRNLLANVLQMLEMNGAYLDEGKDSILTALPLYHIFALTVNALMGMQQGALNVLIPNPRDIFDKLKERVIAVKRQRGVIKMDRGT